MPVAPLGSHLNVGDGLTGGVLHCNIGGSAGATGGSVPLNQWSHVACTYDRQTIRGYVNGVEVASAADTQAIPTSSVNLAIGKEDGFTDRNFDGLIDEVEIFSRALTSAEFQSIYNAGSAGKCRPTVNISEHRLLLLESQSWAGAKCNADPDW